jgi:hypothetical protein
MTVSSVKGQVAFIVVAKVGKFPCQEKNIENGEKSRL